MAAIPSAYEAQKLARYETLKARWVKEHPSATPREFEDYIRWLVQRLKV